MNKKQQLQIMHKKLHTIEDSSELLESIDVRSLSIMNSLLDKLAIYQEKISSVKEEAIFTEEFTLKGTDVILEFRQR